jgi:predicted phosphodiesterase
MATKIQFMSDLHLERTNYDYDIPRAASHLALVGDIGRFCDYDDYAGFLRAQCQTFDQVFLVGGNNESYGSSRKEGLDAANRLMQDPSLQGKLMFLNRTRVDLAGSNVTVLGCTLHSHIKPDCAQLNKDFKSIRDWSVEDHNREHQLDVEWLRTSLGHIADTDPHKQVIILTHHAPSFKDTCHPMHEGNAVSQSFCSNTLEAFRTWKGHEQVSNWIFGHTHWNARFMCGNTTVQSNCLPNQPRNLTWWQRYLMYRPFDPRAVIDSRLARSWGSWIFGM